MDPYLYNYSGIKNAHISIGDIFINPFMGIVDEVGICIGTSKEGFMIWWYTMYPKPEVHRVYTKTDLLKNDIIKVGSRWNTLDIHGPDLVRLNYGKPIEELYSTKDLEKLGEEEIKLFTEVKQ